jgi:hypothetical protein
MDQRIESNSQSKVLEKSTELTQHVKVSSKISIGLLRKLAFKLTHNNGHKNSAIKDQLEKLPTPILLVKNLPILSSNSLTLLDGKSNQCTKNASPTISSHSQNQDVILSADQSNANLSH